MLKLKKSAEKKMVDLNAYDLKQASKDYKRHLLDR